MRIISRSRLREFWEGHRDAQDCLTRWYDLTEQAAWKNPAEVKRTFGAVDFVKVESGNTVCVFDVGGNKYRVIAAVHYDYGRVFVLRVLTHAEYDRKRWMEEL
jgi:mRNA interferase HigB